MKIKRQTISVTLATYNEESNIAACLDSVKDFADEIIIVDGRSQDKTVEIAKKYGAKILLRENNPIFHIQKAIANREAQSDWILQMDADERVTPGMKKEIVGILEGTYFGYDSWISPLKSSVNKYLTVFPRPKKLTEPAPAYWLPRKNFFLNRYLKNAGQYPDPVIRLFQKGKAVLPAKDVHEQMVVHGVTGWLVSDLDHYATPHFSRYLLRENTYSSLKAHQLKEAGVKINIFNTLNYLFFKPLGTFCSLYFRYRGFMDGFPGFVFSLYSGLHHAFSYMKLWELYKDEEYGTN
ncbi:MAG: cell wall biosynthesis glycosyltransferase [uncultured bacterium]|nr:MAG: cell wall biosynthesis glycosyltransferase [uncultured bacterium]